MGPVVSSTKSVSEVVADAAQWTVIQYGTTVAGGRLCAGNRP